MESEAGRKDIDNKEEKKIKERRVERTREKSEEGREKRGEGGESRGGTREASQEIIYKRDERREGQEGNP